MVIIAVDANRRSLLTAAVARLSKYPFSDFMPLLSTPWFVSTPCVVSGLAAEFSAPNLTEPLLACAFMSALMCTFLYAAFQLAHVLSDSSRYSQLSLVRGNLYVVIIAVDANRRSISFAIVRLACPT